MSFDEECASLVESLNCARGFTFYYPTNALNYRNLEIKITLFKGLKDTKLKITPTCFGSDVIHHQGVQECA